MASACWTKGPECSIWGGIHPSFAEPVPEGEEIARLMPVVARLREQRPDAVLSVDTLKAGRPGRIGSGADIINDVSAACRSGVARRACRIQAGVCAHAQSGQPARNAGEPPLRERGGGDSGLFEEHLARLVKAGLPEDRIVLDPASGSVRIRITPWPS